MGETVKVPFPQTVIGRHSGPLSLALAGEQMRGPSRAPSLGLLPSAVGLQGPQPSPGGDGGRSWVWGDVGGFGGRAAWTRGFENLSFNKLTKML